MIVEERIYSNYLSSGQSSLVPLQKDIEWCKNMDLCNCGNLLQPQIMFVLKDIDVTCTIWPFLVAKSQKWDEYLGISYVRNNVVHHASPCSWCIQRKDICRYSFGSAALQALPVCSTVCCKLPKGCWILIFPQGWPLIPFPWLDIALCLGIAARQ